MWTSSRRSGASTAPWPSGSARSTHGFWAARGRWLGVGARFLHALEEHARRAGAQAVRPETNRALTEAIALYRRSGYIDTAPFNAEPYAHHWFEKRF